MSMIQYKGYLAQLEVDADAGVIVGRVLGTRDGITFEGNTPKEALDAFRHSLDDYLAYCAERGREPDKPFSGRVLLRTTPERHRMMVLVATQESKSLNAWLNEVVAMALVGVNLGEVAEPMVLDHAAGPASMAEARAVGTALETTS